MSLQTLNEIDPKIARGTLASAVMSLGGPGIGDVPEQFRELSTAVLSEVRRRLSIVDGEVSREDTDRIRDFLANEISKRVYEGHDKAELVSRLGSEGRLSLGAYSIKANRLFKQAFDKESLAFATRCIRSADLVQHMRIGESPPESSSAGDTFSLFLSKQISKSGRVFFVLISAAREGDVLTIDALWRLYPSIIAFHGASEPLDFFRLFANYYGLELTLNSERTGQRWLENVSAINLEDEIVDVAPEESDRKYLLEFMGKREGGKVYIKYAAAIDVRKYRADVVRES